MGDDSSAAPPICSATVSPDHGFPAVVIVAGGGGLCLPNGIPGIQYQSTPWLAGIHPPKDPVARHDRIAHRGKIPVASPQRAPCDHHLYRVILLKNTIVGNECLSWMHLVTGENSQWDRGRKMIGPWSRSDVWSLEGHRALNPREEARITWMWVAKVNPVVRVRE